MVVKKYTDFINEGLWKSGVDRAKSSEIRLEDRFTGDDLEFFKKVKSWSFDEFLKQNADVDDFTQDVFNDMMDMYEDTVKNYIDEHGFLDIYFNEKESGEDHKPLNLPEFNKTYSIGVPKPCKINVIYRADTDQSYKISIGDKGDEFDMSSFDFSVELFEKLFRHLIKYVLDDNRELIKRNLEINFDDYKTQFHNILVEDLLDAFEYEDKIIPFEKCNYFDDVNDDMIELSCEFCINQITKNKVELGMDSTGDNYAEDITNSQMGKEILETIKNAYNEAVKKFKDGV